MHQNIERMARNMIVAFIARPVTGVRNPNTLCLCDVANPEALPLPADRGYKGREDGGAQIWLTLEKHHRPHAPQVAMPLAFVKSQRNGINLPDHRAKSFIGRLFC